MIFFQLSGFEILRAKLSFRSCWLRGYRDKKMRDYNVSCTGADQKYLSGLPLPGITAVEYTGNVTLGKVVNGRLWSKALFGGYRLQNLSDAASIWVVNCYWKKSILTV